MNDEELKLQLRRAYRSSDTAPPDFDLVWDAAEAQAHRRVPYRAIAAGIAAIAVVALIGLNQWPDSVTDADSNLFAAGQNDSWIAEIDMSLLNATAWSAPSDVLLPENELDIYTTLPTLIESTEMEVDALL